MGAPNNTARHVKSTTAQAAAKHGGPFRVGTSLGSWQHSQGCCTVFNEAKVWTRWQNTVHEKVTAAEYVCDHELNVTIRLLLTVRILVRHCCIASSLGAAPPPGTGASKNGTW